MLLRRRAAAGTTQLKPPQLNVEALSPVPPAPPPVAADAVEFEDTPVVDCGPGPGVLLSERSYAEAIQDRSRRQLAEAQVRIITELRRAEGEAYQEAFEAAYQRAVKSREDAESTRSWRPWVFMGGVVVGGLVATLVATAAVKGVE